MSALLDPVSAPSPQKPVAQKTAPPKPPSKIPILLGIVATILGAWGLWQWSAAREQAAANASAVSMIRTAKVTRGTLEVRARITGNTTSRNFANIIAPKLQGPEGDSAMLLMTMAPSGSFVKKGEVVAEFDPQSLSDHLDDRRATLRDSDNTVLKRKSELELDMQRLQQNLLVAKASLEKAKLDLRTVEVRTAIDREMMQLALEEAEAAYKEIQSQIPLKQASQKADMRITMLSREQDSQHVQRHENDLKRFVLRSPIDGMVVILSMPRQGGDQVSYALGDRVTPGTTFMKVIDTSSMQVEGTINQTESSNFRLGQQAKVGLDAYPGLMFPAEVYSIGALATSGGRQQYFNRSLPVRVRINAIDKRLIPDLSAHASILLNQVPNVLLAPAAAVRRQGVGHIVAVKKGKDFENQPVTVLASNGTEVALSGVNPGDELRTDEGF